MKKIIDEFNGFLGLISQKTKGETKDSDDLEKVLELLLEIRNELRDNKMWTLADRIRDELVKIGYIIEDKSAGSALKKS